MCNAVSVTRMGTGISALKSSGTNTILQAICLLFNCPLTVAFYCILAVLDLSHRVVYERCMDCKYIDTKFREKKDFVERWNVQHTRKEYIYFFS